MIDPRAVQGPRTFPPLMTEEQQANWKDILTNVIGALRSANIDWCQVFAANRGYWRDVSKATVIIKAEIPDRHRTTIDQLEENLEEHNFRLEIMGTKTLWGLFGDLTAAVEDKAVRTNLGWPFPPVIHGMGISISMTFESTPSTVGGYLKISDNNGEHVVGLACYHGVREDGQGEVNPNIDSGGATDLSWPCQSPAYHDVRIFAKPLEYDLNRPVPENAPPFAKALDLASRQENARKLKQIQSFNPFIGDIFAVSGRRNLPLGPGLDAPSTFVDWACLKMSEEHCPCIANSISKWDARLLENFPEGLPHWKTNKHQVDSVANAPDEAIAVFKQGRTTGLTAGILGGFAPAAYRLKGLPGHLYRRGYIIFSSPFRQAFCEPGDSGWWCLNGDGDVIGQLVGGDQADGTGLMIPFSTVVEDIERMLKLAPGSVRLA